MVPFKAALYFDLDEGQWKQTAEQTSVLSWREDAKTTFSDWTIRIRSEGKSKEIPSNDGQIKRRKVEGSSNESVYNVHKVLLATGERSSGYFRTQFRLNSATIETSTSTTVLELSESCADCFPLLLDFIYDDCLLLDDATVVPLMELARRLDMPRLGCETIRWVQEALATRGPSCAPRFLKEAVEFQMDKLRAACLEVIVGTFAHADPNSLSWLPLDSLVEVLQNDLLQARSEDQVYEVVLHYLKAVDIQESDRRRQLWLCVRFGFLTFPKQREALNQVGIPKDVFLQDAVARIGELSLGAGALECMRADMSNESARRLMRRRGTQMSGETTRRLTIRRTQSVAQDID